MKQHVFLLRNDDLYSVYTFKIKSSLDTSTFSQVSNCGGVVLAICLDHKFQWQAQTFSFKPSSGICDPNKTRARHHCKIEFDLKSIKKEFLLIPQPGPQSDF